jgi:hypothetical protein
LQKQFVQFRIGKGSDPFPGTKTGNVHLPYFRRHSCCRSIEKLLPRQAS